jgi:hypothetical protein
MEAMNRPEKYRLVVCQAVIAFSIVLLPCVAAGALGPEARCQRSRYIAFAKYIACQQKVMAGVVSDIDHDSDDTFFEFNAALFRCRHKYAHSWIRLQAQVTGSTCDNPRFVDNGDGTVTDRFSGLQWEKKTSDGSVHDFGNYYTWGSTADGNDTNADGQTFTTFLRALNSDPCFAGHCDWRIPDVYDLQTIL